MTCPNCGTENPPGARFCVACGQALPRVCPNCGATNPPSARFCNQCGANLDALSSAPAAEAEPSAAAPAEDNGETEETEQRRVVTVLFADLTSSTALGESLDAEELRALLARFFAAMTRVIHRHGGSVEKYIGDAIMAVFGLPVTHEDDPVRAVRAALEMQGRLRELNAERLLPDGSSAPELKMRIGVNTGEVAAAGAAREGQDFLITGDPVNVAARLQQLAKPGSVLVGPRAYRSTRGVIKYRALPPAPLRGKARPVSIWEATGLLDESAPAPRPRGLDGARAPLVGREVEMALLDAVSARVMRERNPHLITILGAPGVGKTRLAREFIRRTVGAGSLRELVAIAQSAARADLTGQPVPTGPLPLEGRCPPYGEDVTYWPLTEMLRLYAGFTALETPENARAKLLASVRARLAAAGRAEYPELITTFLAYTIGIESPERRATLLPSDARQLQEGAQRAWRVFFEALATGRGLIALIDDAHWADDALLDLLASVAGQASGVPLLFILTARPDLIERRPSWGGGRRNYVTLGLEPLSPHDTRRLLDELLPGPGVPDSLREGILGKADGNPFYVEEIVRMLIDRDALTRDDDGWRLAAGWASPGEAMDPVIPDTVQGVLAARLDLLTPAERDVLRHAAVIGRYFWPSALLSLAPHLQPASLQATLHTLRGKDLIRVSERSAIGVAPPGEEVYTFHHALIREVVYSSIPRTRRAHEHLRVAEWLESLTPAQPHGVAELLAQHYYRYYTLANLARSRNVERRRETRAKVIAALHLAGERAVTLHALAKADTYFSDALDLLTSDDDPNDIPAVVALLVARASARWLAMRADDAWEDYREALRAWASVSSAITSGSAAPVSTPAATGVPNGSGDSGGSSGRFAAPRILAEGECAVSALPPDWRQTGMRLYRALTLLPARNTGLFRQPPPHEELLAYLEEGLRLADELGQRDTLDYAELLTAKAFFWWSWAERRGERELLDAYRSAREAVRITENLGDPRAASEALDALGNLQATMSDLTRYLESQQRRLRWAEAIEERQELVDINTEVSQAYQLVGDFAESVRYASAASDLATEAASDELRVKALWRLALAWVEWDHWPEAIQASAELNERAQRTVMRHAAHHRWALLALATIYTRMGDADTATRLIRAGVESSEPTERAPQYVELARARLALARGAIREARQILLAALDLRSGRHSMVAVMAELAEIAARLGDSDLYDRFGPGALELGWRSGARKALAQAVRARAIVAISAGRWDDALADAQSAIRRYGELGCDWEEARSRYALAGLYRRRHDTYDADHAREELTRALAIFERLQSVRDIARARAALAGGDVRLP